MYKQLAQGFGVYSYSRSLNLVPIEINSILGPISHWTSRELN